MNELDRIKSYFGFIKMPFTNNALGEREFFKSSAFIEAETRLSLALETEKLFVLTGESGCGKSSLLRYFVSQLDPGCYKPVYVPAETDMKFSGMIKAALAEMQMEVPYNSTKARREFKSSIERFNKEKGIKTVLIIDEAHDLPAYTLLSLKPLLNYHFDSENYLFVILCGQNTLLELISLYPLTSLKKRIRIGYSMQPLSLTETANYISHQMKACGVERTVFSDEVKSRIYERTKGNTAEINDLCFNLVIHAAAHSKDIIEISMLNDVEKSRNDGRGVT
jgi:general secretion pathway protein A